MSQWANFVITKVKYNSPHTHIIEVETRPDTGESIGSPTRRSRQDVVNAIKRGTTFVTAYYRDNKWHKGEDVGIVQVSGEEYLRTDSNSVKADNLGSLPEY